MKKEKTLLETISIPAFSTYPKSSSPLDPLGTALYLNCENPDDISLMPCYKCESCKTVMTTR